MYIRNMLFIQQAFSVHTYRNEVIAQYKAKTFYMDIIPHTILHMAVFSFQ